VWEVSFCIPTSFLCYGPLSVVLFSATDEFVGGVVPMGESQWSDRINTGRPRMWGCIPSYCISGQVFHNASGSLKVEDQGVFLCFWGSVFVSTA